MKYLFDSIFVDMLSNEKLEPAVTKLFICDRKLNISLVFISESYFAAPKNFWLNSTYYFMMKIPFRWELQQIVINNWFDVEINDFIKIYKICTNEPYFFLINDMLFHQIILSIFERTWFIKFHRKKPFNNHEYKKHSWQLIRELRMQIFNTILIAKLQNFSIIIR